ncbi:hypothetical protein O3B60_002134, partial [Neisseria gonorrhoeae]
CFPCSKPQPQQPTRPLSLWERAGERATSRKACIWAVELLGKIAATWKVPSPQPSAAQGRERIAAGLAVAGGFKSSAGMTVFWFIY